MNHKTALKILNEYLREKAREERILRKELGICAHVSCKRKAQLSVHTGKPSVMCFKCNERNCESVRKAKEKKKTKMLDNFSGLSEYTIKNNE